jgi:hypothetical protein
MLTPICATCARRPLNVTAQRKTPERVQALPGLDDRYASAAFVQNYTTSNRPAPSLMTDELAFQVQRLRMNYGEGDQ